jgi:predicted CXXCH cytochrome family protein
MKILLRKHTMTRKSYLGAFSKLPLGQSNNFNLHLSAAFIEFFSLSGVMLLARGTVTNLAITFTCMVSASAWAASGYIYNADKVSTVAENNTTLRLAENDAVVSGTTINSDVPTVATDPSPTATGSASVSAATTSTAIPTTNNTAAGAQNQPAVDYLRPKETDGLPFFVPAASAPPSTAASDAALTAATVDTAAAADISRNEAAAGLFGKHNFTATGVATGEICAFCHAPQGVEAKVAAPLWNRSFSPLSDYRAFSTLGSATAAASGSVSLACLSCHDGTQAPNIVINTPAKDGTGSDSINGTKTDSSLYLKGHHPVGMQYGGGGPNHASPGSPLKLDDFRSTTYSGTGSGTVWWIDTGDKGRQKTDLLLFTRTDTSNNLPISQPYVECASCHDPHRITSPTFLRVPNTVGSALCLTCHAK